jgi:MerR family transcriptional regulator, light-induced transcriptional regulator
MSVEDGVTALRIGDVARRTGVAEGTLRMWESRHGFPVPQRLSSGHRRYSERDVELVRQIASQRTAGITLAVAIDRVLRDIQAPARSLYATLRRRRRDLQPSRLPERTMLALSRAIEDESLSRAERPLLFAFFQRERHYRHAAARWRELARTARLTIAFADFQRPRTPDDGPIELCVATSDPLAREWAIVCDAPGHAVCLTAWELPTSTSASDHDRVFEVIWSVEPAFVREAARICADIATAREPALIGADVRMRLDRPPSQPAAEQLLLATAIANRTLVYLS